MQDKIYLGTEPNEEQNQLKMPNASFDKEFVKYVNGFSDSIKEYCRFAKDNIRESSESLNSSKFITEQITIILNEKMNMNNQEVINELFQKIEILNSNLHNIEENLNSNTESISLFYNDAKFLVKLMKDLRKKYFNEANFNSNKRSISPNMRNKMDINNNNSGLNLFSNNDNEHKKLLNNLSNEILTAIKNFGNNLLNLYDIKKRYDEMGNNIKIKLDKLISMSTNARTNINGSKVQINRLVNTNKVYNRSKSPSTSNKLKYAFENLNQNNKAYGFDNINQNNKSYELKINELQGQIKTFKQKIQFLENKLKMKRENSDININNNHNRVSDASSSINKLLRKNEDNQNYSPCPQIKLSNVNSNNNINNPILFKKDNEIMLYKNKLNIYQKRINILTTELNKIKRENLEKKNMIQNLQNFKNYNNERHTTNKEYETNQENQQKGQYEELIKELREEILNYKNIISMNQNRILKYENQIRELRSSNGNLFNRNNNDNDKFKLNPFNNNDTITKLQKELKFKNSQILKLNNQIKIIGNDRNRLNMQLQSYISGSLQNSNLQNRNQIEELNNHIINLNKIIEEKNNIINQQNNFKMQNFSGSSIPQLIEENNNLKQELSKYADNRNIGFDFDYLMKENQEFKKQYEELQDKFIKTKISYESNLKKLQNNSQNKDLMNELMEYKNSLLNTELERDKLVKELSDLKKNNNLIISNNSNDNAELLKTINELSSNLEVIKDSKYKLENEIKKKNEELEGLQIFIKKLQSEREKMDDIKYRSNSAIANCNDISGLSQNDKEGGIPFEKYENVINKLNEAEKQIEMLQKSTKDLQNKLGEKEEQKLAVCRTEDFNFSNYEEEFGYRKLMNGARDKNRSEDVNIDYPGVQDIKEKQNQLLWKMNLLEEQIKILLCNINCSGKIKPTVTQICQLLGLDHQKIQMVISGKDKKTALGMTG